MFASKETKIYSAICMIAVVLAVCYGIWADEGVAFFLIILGLVIAIYLAGLFVIKSFLRRLESVRKATVEIIDRGSEQLELSIPEKYTEGEIGKLAESMSEVVGILRESEEKQRREKEFLRDMISDISHQLKTPIASLTVFTDLLLEDAEKTEDAEKAGDVKKTEESKKSGLSLEKKIEILQQAGIQLERMTWLTQSMLQLARIEAESITFHNEETDINALLASCVDILRERANEKGQKFLFTGDENVMVKVDGEWFKEAVINIIKNAVDYAPCDSEIILDVRQTPIATKISIKDYGCGIPEADRLNIFKRFYRVSGNNVNPSSVGIGLALSKSIIEGIGGRIRVESRHISQCQQGEEAYTNMIITL